MDSGSLPRKEIFGWSGGGYDKLGDFLMELR